MIRNKKIYYEIIGDKSLPTFLYLHGGPGVGSYDFNFIQGERLSKFINIISIDQRGCLRSDEIKENEEFYFQDLIDDCEEVRNHFNINSWGIISHSFGGYLAIEYAIQHQGVIDRLILECPTFDLIESFRSVVKKTEELYRSEGNNELADRCKDAYSLSVQELDRVFQDISDKRGLVYIRALDPNFFDDVIRQSGIPEKDWGKQGMFQQKLNHEGKIFTPILDKLSKINCPTLLIKGRYDPIASENQTEEFIKSVPNGIVKELNNSAHMPRFEEPELYAEVIREFVSSTEKSHGIR